MVIWTLSYVIIIILNFINFSSTLLAPYSTTYGASHKACPTHNYKLIPRRLNFNYNLTPLDLFRQKLLIDIPRKSS